MIKKDRKSLLLGGFICLGVLGFLAVSLFFPRAHGNGKQEIQVAFTSAGGAVRGMNVCFAGRVIGNVTAIHNIVDEGKEDLQGHLYCYKLILKIDSSIPVYKEDSIAMYSPKIIGEPIINIFPNKARKGGKKISSQDLVFGESISPLDKLMQCLDKADKTMSTLKEEVSEISSKIVNILDADKEMSLTAHILLAAESIENFAKRLSECLDTSRIGKMDKFIDECHDVACTVRSYGLLYQYSPKWKRLQKRLEEKNLISSQEK
ncbi:MlaD family protein [Chlamydia sp. 17-3921]|uniref:MlaD family protein n=1 Tax=Chlamydia sp. 17-3921 TaxID=2675798 RepID=UPI00191985AA|nr:MlaD family protein [Chlamydia sp. 17-3921]